MFGYIRPFEEELLVREYREYRAYYCGLCKTIAARYGLAARLTLQYDCAFLGALLTLQSDAGKWEKKRCCLHCIRGKQPMAQPTDALCYAADVNVLLGYYAARDKWRDERHVGAGILRLLLTGAFRKARERQPVLAREIGGCLTRLEDMEKRRVACTDEPSDAFGELMRAVILHGPIERAGDREAFSWMFYNLGRWIYLADAWDDRKKDQKSGSYNPFLITGKSRDDAEFLLYISLAEAEKGYDLITLDGPHGLTDNIVRMGCRVRTKQLLDEDDTGETKENGA